MKFASKGVRPIYYVTMDKVASSLPLKFLLKNKEGKDNSNELFESLGNKSHPANTIQTATYVILV